MDDDDAYGWRNLGVFTRSSLPPDGTPPVTVCRYLALLDRIHVTSRDIHGVLYADIGMA
jgi:hypothetical protein